MIRSSQLGLCTTRNCSSSGKLNHSNFVISTQSDREVQYGTDLRDTRH
jgi:hypothetical protein